MVIFLLFIVFLFEFVQSGGHVHASVNLGPIVDQLNTMNKQIANLPADIKSDMQMTINAFVNTANSLLNTMTKSMDKNFQNIQGDLDKNFGAADKLMEKGIGVMDKDFHYAVQDVNEMMNKTASQIEAWAQKDINRALDLMHQLVHQLRDFEMAFIVSMNKLICHFDSDFARLENVFLEIFDAVLDGNHDCREKLGLVGKVIPFDSYVVNYRFKKCVLVSDLDEMSNLDDIVTKYEELDLLIGSFLCMTNSSESLKKYFMKEKTDVIHHLKFLNHFATPNRDFISMNDTRHPTSRMVQEYANSVVNVLDVLNVVNTEQTSNMINTVTQTVPSSFVLTSFFVMIFFLPLVILVTLGTISCMICFMLLKSCRKNFFFNTKRNNQKEENELLNDDLRNLILNEILSSSSSQQKQEKEKKKEGKKDKKSEYEEL